MRMAGVAAPVMTGLILRHQNRGQSGGHPLLSVVISATRDANLAVNDLVNKAVFVSDAARPVARQPALERLGLADSLVSVPADLLDELVDAFECATILGLPPYVILPGGLVPDKEHGLILYEIVGAAATVLQILNRVEESASVSGRAEQVGGFA